MPETMEPRFAGVMDHVAVNASDLAHDVGPEHKTRETKALLASLVLSRLARSGQVNRQPIIP